MRKVIACLVLLVFLFQMTSCYRDYVYDLSWMTETTAMSYEILETENILESGEPLAPYVIYDGIRDATSDANALRPSYWQGVCRNLKGKPVVVLLFMDDDETSWSEEEVVSFTNGTVMPALQFIKNEAARWGTELDFQVESYSTALTGYTLDYFGVMPDNHRKDEYNDQLEQAAGDLGFSSEWVLYSYMQYQHPGQDIVFVMLFNKNGRSFTRIHVEDGYYRGVEYCIVYSDPAYKAAPVMAHEILHLFGAEDLYAEAYSEVRASAARERYPTDIMISAYSLTENNIDAYTAYCIGWTQDIPDVCYLEEWYLDESGE